MSIKRAFLLVVSFISAVMTSNLKLEVSKGDIPSSLIFACLRVIVLTNGNRKQNLLLVTLTFTDQTTSASNLKGFKRKSESLPNQETQIANLNCILTK